MNLIEIRELYKNQEAYLDKEITVGGWVRSIRDSKAFGFIVINDGTFLHHFKSYIMMIWRTLRRFPNSM